MSSNPVADGHYRIRKAGAKSDIAKAISNGKKCHYVQIGIDMVGFANLEEAIEYVADKDLVADRMSLDFGMAPACLLYTSPSPRDKRQSRMPSSA